MTAVMPDYDKLFDVAVTILQTVTVQNGYAFDLAIRDDMARRVVTLDFAMSSGLGWPYVFVTRDQGREPRNEALGQRFPKSYKATLPVLVVAYLKTDQSAGLKCDQEANKLINDVQKAFVAQFALLQAQNALDITFVQGPEIAHTLDPRGIVFSEIFIPIGITYMLPFAGY